MYVFAKLVISNSFSFIHLAHQVRLQWH